MRDDALHQQIITVHSALNTIHRIIRNTEKFVYCFELTTMKNKTRNERHKCVCAGLRRNKSVDSKYLRSIHSIISEPFEGRIA